MIYATMFLFIGYFLRCMKLKKKSSTIYFMLLVLNSLKNTFIFDFIKKL